MNSTMIRETTADRDRCNRCRRILFHGKCPLHGFHTVPMIDTPTMPEIIAFIKALKAMRDGRAG